MNKKLILGLLLSVSMTANAGTTRNVQADNIVTTSGTSLAVPATGANVLSDTSTATVTNKSMSGASNTFTAIPAGTALSGQVGVPNGGTGLSTITSNALMVGNGTASPTLITGSQYQSVVAGSGGAPSFGAVPLNQSAAVSGALGAANGGTGNTSLTSNNLLVGNGTGAVTFIAPGTANNVLTSNGSAWISQAAPSTAPNVVASAASPQSVTAAAGVSVTGLSYYNLVFVTGSPGAVTVSATPSITQCTQPGQNLILIGESATNTVTLQDNAGLAGSKLQLNGNITLGLYSSITLECDAATGNWVEVSRR